jgi:hypothetical protein
VTGPADAHLDQAFAEFSIIVALHRVIVKKLSTGPKNGLEAPPEWIARELRISYFGSVTLDAGDYEDRLILTISAK